MDDFDFRNECMQRGAGTEKPAYDAEKRASLRRLQAWGCWGCGVILSLAGVALPGLLLSYAAVGAYAVALVFFALSVIRR